MSIIKEKKIESYPEPVYSDLMEKILDQMRKCVCKVCIDNVEKGTGFFCKIPDKDKVLPVLITNNHVINEKILEKENYKITLSINNDNEFKEIELKDRKKYTNKDYDITIIEIKEEKDNIKHYLDLDKNAENDIYTPFIGESIYILHYPGSKNVAASFGILKS